LPYCTFVVELVSFCGAMDNFMYKFGANACRCFFGAFIGRLLGFISAKRGSEQE
jgi:hypothetical protein